eukprot:CAMPEP_0114994824 /NCGR_PEP_ID=MMETSP0216-20121206/13363_1 /TAXON_ID=223996 /ORGANISM="Protocruzia adherens, Strain Boccale" /LENGTH=706 /DNA_ID=CAMNT_0002358747 /DNA_START=417 /DNA_END=2537 /DNA_ORIENTATION=+
MKKAGAKKAAGTKKAATDSKKTAADKKPAEKKADAGAKKAGAKKTAEKKPKDDLKKETDKKPKAAAGAKKGAAKDTGKKTAGGKKAAAGKKKGLSSSSSKKTLDDHEKSVQESVADIREEITGEMLVTEEGQGGDHEDLNGHNTGDVGAEHLYDHNDEPHVEIHDDEEEKVEKTELKGSVVESHDEHINTPGSSRTMSRTSSAGKFTRSSKRKKSSFLEPTASSKMKENEMTPYEKRQLKKNERSSSRKVTGSSVREDTKSDHGQETPTSFNPDEEDHEEQNGDNEEGKKKQEAEPIDESSPEFQEQLEKIRSEQREIPDDIVAMKQKELAQLKVELSRLENAYSHFKKGNGSGHQDGILQRMRSPRPGANRSTKNLQSPSQNRTFLGDGPSTLSSPGLGISQIASAPRSRTNGSSDSQDVSLYALLCAQIGEDNFNKIRYMFDCYTISNTKSRNTIMDMTQYHKFLKDHRICNKSFSLSKADIIFCKNNKQKCLDLMKFVETVIILAEKKYADVKRIEAVSRLVQSFNMGIFEASSERKQYYQTIGADLKHDDVKLLFQARMSVLELVFQNHMSQNYEERRTISIYNFLAALTELAIIPELISKLEAMQMFKLWQPDSTTPIAKYRLGFEDFAECIGIIALHGFSQERYAERYPLSVDKVDALFQMMEIASAHTSYGKELELRMRSLQSNRKLNAVYTLNTQPVN